MKFRYGADDLTSYNRDNMEYVKAWIDALDKYSGEEIEEIRNSKKISDKDRQRLKLHEREKNAYMQRRRNYSDAINYINSLKKVTDFVHNQQEYSNRFNNGGKRGMLGDEAISMIFDFSDTPESEEINAKLFEHLGERVNGKFTANLAIASNYSFVNSYGPEQLAGLLKGDDKSAVGSIDIIRKLDALKNIAATRQQLAGYGIEVDNALMDKLEAYYLQNKTVIEALSAKADKISNIIYMNFGDDPFITPEIVTALFKKADETDVFSEEIKDCFSYYAPVENLIMENEPEYSPEMIGKSQPENEKEAAERLKKMKAQLKPSEISEFEEKQPEEVNPEERQPEAEQPEDVNPGEKQPEASYTSVVTGTYTKNSFSAFQNIFKAELEDKEVPGMIDDGDGGGGEKLQKFFSNGGVSEDMALKFAEQAEQLSRKLTDLSRVNSHGLPQNLDADDYAELKSYYDDFIDLCRDIDKKLSKEAFNDGGSLYKKIQAALNADIHIVNELKEKHPEVPLELAFNNIKTRTISGSLKGAGSVGAGQNKRVVITIVDDYGVSRTGVYTLANEVTDSMIVNHDENVANNLNVDVLKIQKGERIDSRNSAMYDMANLLGRPDLIAPSMDVKLEGRGNVVEGNFMEFINGTDLDHMSSRDPYFDINPDDYISDSVKRDMLDLTVIDYLCLNVDRHGGNIIYQYGKDKNNVTRLTGIKGIDNDSSFGAENPNIDEHLVRIQPMTSTVLMTEEMAEKIKGMDRKTLELTLSKYKMNPAAVTAAYKRLVMLKDFLRFGEETSRELKTLQTLRDKQASGSILSQEEAKELKNMEARYKGFESNPIKFVQRNRSFNGTIPKQNYRPGIAVIPKGMLKNIDFDAMGKTTTLKDRRTGDVMHCGVIDNVTFEHNSQGRKNANMDLTIKRYKKLRQIDNGPNPELRIGGENINGAARVLGTENGKLLTELKEIAGDSRDADFNPLIAEMTKLKALSGKIGEEGYVPTDMEVNVLTGYIQSIKAECEKCKQAMNHNGIINLADRIKKEKILDKIAETMTPMISRVRDAQERDLLAFNVNMAKEAEDIQTGRRAIVADGYKDADIEPMLIKPVTSYSSSIVEFSYAVKTIANGNKKEDLSFCKPFLNSLNEIEMLTTKLNLSEKPAIGDISKLRNAYKAAIEWSVALQGADRSTPAEKQMKYLARSIGNCLRQDKSIIDMFKPGDKRSFAVQYVDSVINGGDSISLINGAINEMAVDIKTISDIDSNRKKSSPEFKKLAVCADSVMKIKDPKRLPEVLVELEKSCIDYIAKHKGIARNDLEQSCMVHAYNMKFSCHKFRTAHNIVKQMEQKNLGRQPGEKELQVNNPVM